MRWETYIFLRDYIDNQIEKIHQEYVVACDYIPYGKRGTARLKAADKMREKQAELYAMKGELFNAAKKSNPKMREFWEV